MAVLINGIEMPGVFCGADIVLYEGVNGAAFPRKYKISADKIVPVPPHGRLIDADAILNSKGVGTQIAGWGKMYHETVIEYAPTVIPAEREGE